MTHIVTKTVLLDGPKDALIHVYLESDGVQSELSNFVLIDPSTDFANLIAAPANTKLLIKQVWHSFSWFDATLSFENTTNQPSWVFARDAMNYSDFRFFGGLKDVSGLDGTGKILLTTNGFMNPGSVGTMVVALTKTIRQSTELPPT